MASRIAGITVEIGGDTTKLSKALENVNKTIKTTQSELKDVNKLLKLDPSNTETVTQKQRMLKDAIEATKEKLTTLKTAAEQANQQLADGKITQSVITGVHPYWQNSETGEVTELPEKVVLVEQRSVPYQKITVLDCTSGFQDKPTDEMMRSFAQDYLKNTSLTEPQVDIDIDFIQLWNTPDYEDVVEAEQVSLCDTVHVFISKLGIEVSSKVTETQYDCLLERYEGITLSNSTVSSRNSSLTTALSNIRNTANEAYNTALRVETSMGEQIGGISVSMVYDGTLLAGLFGLHYQNVTEVNGETVRYAFNAGSLAKSTFAWKNSPAGFFISTDGGKTWGYGWERDDSPVKTALLLENTLQELDERYKKAGELTEELLEQLDERYKTDDSTCDFVLSILAAVAQDESHSISENEKAAYASRFARGEYNLGNNRILGYDCVDGELVPNKDAWIVKEVFRRFIEGESWVPETHEEEIV